MWKTPSKMAARIQNRASPNPLPAQDVDHEQYQGLFGASAQANAKPNFPEAACCLKTMIGNYDWNLNTLEL